MFTENLPGLYGASFPLPKLPASPFHRAQHKWPAHTQAITLPHWKYIFVLFLRSVNSALLCSPSFKGNLIPSWPGGRSLSQPHISLALFHHHCVSPFVICKWKKVIPHALLSMQGDMRCICRNPQPRGPMKASFLCSHVPLPLISSYFTHGLWIGLYLSVRRALIGWKEEIMIPIPPVLFSPPFC